MPRTSQGRAAPILDYLEERHALLDFKLGVKARSLGIHRTLNRAPKGKGR
jgi:hypothetical protein